MLQDSTLDRNTDLSYGAKTPVEYEQNFKIAEKELKKLQSINLDFSHQIKDLQDELDSEKERSNRLIKSNDKLEKSKTKMKEIDF